MSAATDALGLGRPASSTRAVSWARLWWLPLALILSAQVFLSIGLLNYFPGSDEGRYIYAGHQLIYELWHGGGSPYYETFFSGAPDIYPPIAAMVDFAGGIVAVRLMSLVFMLIATTLLFATTRRLFGYGAACAAAALFAALGLTHSVSAYANYDAMSLMLMAMAAYCAVRSGQKHASGGWLITVPLILLAANATKYTTLLFDPVVIAMAAFQTPDWRRAAKRVIALGAATGVVLVVAAVLAGTAYIHGIMFTTFARKSGAQVLLAASAASSHTILKESWNWIGIVIVLGVMAIAVASVGQKGGMRVGLLILMVIAGLLVMLEAFHLHSDESMNQHEDFGAWFTCVAGGYALSGIASLSSMRFRRYAGTVAAVAVVGVIGINYAFTGRGIAAASANQVQDGLIVAGEARPYLHLQSGHYLISGGFQQMLYLDHVNVPWFDLADDNYLKIPIVGRGGDWHDQVQGRACLSVRPGCVYLEGPAAFRTAIHAHYFDLITLYGRPANLYTNRALEDWVIIQAVDRTRGYKLLCEVGGAPTWIYAPAYRKYLHRDA